MKKTFLLSTLAASLLFASCDKLEDINKNPNNPEDVPVYTLLKHQIITTEQRNWNAAFLYGGALSQQTARTAYTDIDRYKMAIGSQGGDFSNTYYDLVNLRILQSKAKSATNLALLGAAQVLEAFQIKLLTDMYGDIPYSKAVDYDLSTGVINTAKPVYDTQESIYTALIKLLKEANANLAAGAAKSTPDAIGVGDYLFNQKTLKWQKFSNSLLIRLYMQMSNKKPADAGAGIAEILANPTQFPIVSSNDDNVTFKYAAGATEANWNPLYYSEVKRPSDNGTSSTFIEYLKQMNDPRLPVLATPTKRSGVSGYWGFPNGESGTTLAVSDYGPTFGKDAFGVNQGRANVWLSYAEVQLLLAEAKQSGLIATGDAQVYYDNAVKANFNEYKIDAAASAYLAADGNFTTPTDKLQLIYRELWVSTYLKGNQGWDLIRRVGSLGGLVTEVSKSVYKGKGIPNRLSYPISEKTLNSINWTDATSRQNLSESDNMLYGKMWWQN